MSFHRIELTHKNHLKHQLRQRDGDNCWICGLEMDFHYHDKFHGGHPLKSSIDHIDPEGSNELSNLKLAHRVCNMVKDRTQITSRIQLACKIIVEEYTNEKRRRVPGLPTQATA